jgi:hypothetical protein
MEVTRECEVELLELVAVGSDDVTSFSYAVPLDVGEEVSKTY